MKKKYLLGFLIISFCFILVGCQEKEDTIIGKWKYKLNDNYIAHLEFKNDDSGIYYFKTPNLEKSKFFTYKIEEKKITIKFIDNVDLREFADHFGAYLDREKALTVTYDKYWIENNKLYFEISGDPSFRVSLDKE